MPIYTIPAGDAANFAMQTYVVPNGDAANFVFAVIMAGAATRKPIMAALRGLNL